jgi:hypothetical protein
MDNVIWNTLADKLVDYCTSLDVKVYFKRGCQDGYTLENQKIEINSNRTKQNQVYILLHEIGHHKIISDNKLAKKFAVLNKTHSHNLSNKILNVEEEVMAWHYGENLATELEIELGPKYQVLKAKCLKSYISK